MTAASTLERHGAARRSNPFNTPIPGGVGDTGPPRFARVGWTRGEGCLPVAELVATETTVPLRDNNLARACIDRRVDLLVTRQFSSFDLVPNIVPINVERSRIRSINAAIGDGPHSLLAAALTDHLATTLGVPGVLTTVYRSDDELATAINRMYRVHSRYPDLGRQIIQGASAAKLTDGLDTNTLLVIGAPEDAWFQRQLYGPGPSFVTEAPGGALIVRNAPRRCFHAAVNAAGYALGPDLAASDANSVVRGPTASVARDGHLIGIVRRSALETARAGATVGDLMEAPVAVHPTEALDAAAELGSFLDSGPIPVIDGDTRLLGILPLAPAASPA